ncbi:MAG: hypothetical protein ACE5I9_01705 [Candidatus Methylomirabilales bacterium]
MSLGEDKPKTTVYGGTSFVATKNFNDDGASRWRETPEALEE